MNGMNRTSRPARLSRLVRLYPRGWRERYGDEFAALLDDTTGRIPRLLLTWDIIRGAIDAHLQGRYSTMRFPKDHAVRRGLIDGLAVSAAIAVLVVLTSVVFPGGPNESDDDPEYVIQYFITVGILACLLMAIGARGYRGTGSRQLAGLKSGATAGGVLAVMITLIFLTVNNLFLGIVSQQHDKRVAFAASGWTSMRAYLTATQLKGGLFLVPMLVLLGALLGVAGASIAGGLLRSFRTAS